jgi:hypothetical protein
MFGIPSMGNGLPSAMQQGGPLAITTHGEPNVVLYYNPPVEMAWRWTYANPPDWALDYSFDGGATWTNRGIFSGTQRSENCTQHGALFRVYKAKIGVGRLGPDSNYVIFP